jgi:GT2 family glycosyltransferase
MALSIAAILASRNRRDRTLSCLDSYFSQRSAELLDLRAVLVDDGSTDGTGEAVRAKYPAARVIDGSGELFWAAGMALAERAALLARPDYLLWLNDDVVLDPNALACLLETELHAAPGRCIVVGALRDPETGELTYSGVRRSGIHPLRVQLVRPRDTPAEVETFNGNVVLISRAVREAVGPIDGRFAHAIADFDYGRRAAQANVVNLLGPGTIGTCTREQRVRPWLDPNCSRSARVCALFGPKGIPPRSTARYLRHYGGRSWPVFWLGSYAKALLGALTAPRTKEARV